MTDAVHVTAFLARRHPASLSLSSCSPIAFAGYLRCGTWGCRWCFAHTQEIGATSWRKHTASQKARLAQGLDTANGREIGIDLGS